ncbi:MAG: ABC transporter ATP-binding protein [Eubacteriales bacterium]|jgi:ATP-binding cassette subfamily B multidrug efflux pump|nr:ABC transporter ATP-binding protein [Clostridiales bacterium]
MYKTLLKSVGKYKKTATATPVIIAAETVIEALIPFTTAKLVNEIKGGCDYSVIVKYGAMLFIMACLSLVLGGAAGYTSAIAACGFARNLRRDMFYKVQTYSFENIDKFSSSSLVTRMTTDVTYVQHAFLTVIRLAIRSPLVFLFAIIMAYIMGGSLSAMFVVIVPLLAFGLFMITKKAMPAFRSVFRKYDRMNESIEENVIAIRAVKGFAREEYEKQKFNNAALEIKRDFTKAERIVALTAPLMQSCIYLNMLIVLFFGSKIAISSMGVDLDVGQISAMLTYGIQILISLNMLSMVYVILTISVESIRRISEVLEEVPVITNPKDPIYEVKDGSVDFIGVNFKYSAHAERYALQNINLHIKSGETVGILGGTGSGKSSLVQLIPRLYDVTEGVVKVGGIDVRKYDLETLRNNVAVVLQKNVLFSGTIKENLLWGNENATDEEIREACRLACADEFINSFPDGYNTKIEQGGTNVSGGQKQRLTIARALLKKPKILILDDSTSAVDTRTDAKIRHSFREYIPSTTKIIIAQRIASVIDADKIVVMDGGSIVDIGTHAELIERCEIYRETYDQQIKKSRSSAANVGV